MPINQPTPPPEIGEAFGAGIGDFMDSVPGQEVSPDLRKKSRIGIQVFTLGLSDLETCRPLIESVAVAAGWQFLIGDPPGPAFSSEVYQPGSGMPRVISLSSDKTNQETRWILGTLKHLPEVQNKDYQLQILRVPGLGIEAFWLKSSTPDQPDLVVPFHSLLAEVKTGIPDPMDDFLEKLRWLADRATPHAPDENVERE